jgi:hypothetical protein
LFSGKERQENLSPAGNMNIGREYVGFFGTPDRQRVEAKKVDSAPVCRPLVGKAGRVDSRDLLPQACNGHSEK